MTEHRRQFLKLAAHTAGAAAALSLFPPAIRRALALPANATTGTIQDIEHIVILMLENRSFDHYFGTLRGVRGFRDRHPVPLSSGKPIWYQSDGTHDIPPFRLNTRTTSAQRTPGTPHTFADAQAAWNQGRFGHWPQIKTPSSMGHYQSEDIPFQFALAEAFTICDAHHCSVTTGTDPNRIVHWSGSNFDPEHRARGENCTDAYAEVNNLRCLVSGALPTPGYSYKGSALTWPTLPDLLERAGISWRIYQDPNDNWTGLMHGALAFDSFRNAKPGDPIYEKGMTHHSIEKLASDAKNGTLPQVSWILPTMLESEHPSPSSSLQGAEFTQSVLEALTANPDTWSRTALFLTFDENDGLFDHVPPPAPPSIQDDGTLAGKATLDLRGQYFNDAEHKYQVAEDPYKGSIRPWGLGPRVPMYVISPWTRGGWVNSQVFDHTSIGQFIEERFRIEVPAISPWHRAISGDLTSAFDFVNPNATAFPELPHIRHATTVAILAASAQLPKPAPPATPEALFQEPGIRPSRALPYELHVDARTGAYESTHPTDRTESTADAIESTVPTHRRATRITLTFRNTGRAGAVFHVYDHLHLERIPRRYTVEAGKYLADDWNLHPDAGRYDLWVYGPNGFVREFRGTLHEHTTATTAATPEVKLIYHPADFTIKLIATNHGRQPATVTATANAYRTDGPWTLDIAPGREITQTFTLIASHRWYDFTVTGQDFERRFAGRMENGSPSFSDPAV